MDLNKSMFREYDIRGIYGTDITEDISYQIGRAFATKISRLGQTETLIGYDNRASSPAIEKSLIKGLIDSGINVIKLGLVTTPMYYFAWNHLKTTSGIMITASHNPKEYNGFKITYNAIHNAFGPQIKELYDIIINNDFINSKTKGTIREVNIKNEYIAKVTSDIKLGANKIKVVYDCGNGTTCIVADDIFNHFKNQLEIIPLFNDSNPEFPNHHPDPFVEKNLEQLKAKVKETKADLGVAYDGDGDRIGIVDHNGTMIDVDKYLIIMWRNIYNKVNNKKAVYDVKCTKALEDELNKLGIEPICYRTGNSYLQEYSSKNNIPLAGELSGHVFFRDRYIGADDGIYASLRLIEILTQTNKTIPELLEGITTYYSTKEEKITVPDTIKFEIIEKIKEYCQTEKNYNILTIDGVKVLFNDGFALVRASNTGPNITYRFEANSETRLKEIETEFTELLKSLI